MLDAMRSADWVTRSMRAKAKQIAEADAGHGKPEDVIAQATGLSRRQIRDTLAGVAGRPVSFDAESHDVAGPGDTESQVVVSGILAAVLAEMDSFDAETQVVLAMRFHQGLDFRQIAARLGTSEQRVTELHNAAVLKVHDVMLRAVT
jgi:RNA polymerase sigma factor for flagellar operon FliA